SGRKSEKPHTRWSTSFSSRSTSGVSGVDVLIHETLEFGGQLFVGAAQRGGVPAVDEDRTIRRLSSPRQADPDVGRFGFTGTVDDAAHHREGHRFDAVILHL